MNDDMVYIVLPPQKIVMNVMMDDVRSMNNVELIDDLFQQNKFVLKLLYKIIDELQKHGFIVANRIWDAWTKRELLKENLPKNQHFYMVFLNPTTKYFSKDLITYLKANYDITVVLCFFDPIEGKNSQDAAKKMSWFDAVYSFDPADCEKLKMRYFFQCYSKLRPVRRNDSSDVCFIGWGGKADRVKILSNISQKCAKGSATVDFSLVGKSLMQCSADSHIKIYKRPIQYQRVIDTVCNSNCILDIIQESQSGASLKYLEAICYNKKLLTNNVNIKNYPFYNSDFMKIYDDVDEIDIEWLKKREDIDYGYRNEYSPVKLIERIRKNI